MSVVVTAGREKMMVSINVLMAIICLIFIPPVSWQDRRYRDIAGDINCTPRKQTSSKPTKCFLFQQPWALRSRGQMSPLAIYACSSSPHPWADLLGVGRVWDLGLS